MTILDRMYEWAAQKEPEGPQWTSPSFNCYRAFPLEIRILLSTDKLENELTNSGLPQFLWNTYYHWRKILEDCKVGYALIGASSQAAAMDTFWERCALHEAECKSYITLCVVERDFGKFSEWINKSTESFKTNLEHLFYTDARLDDLKIHYFMQSENLSKMLDDFKG